MTQEKLDRRAVILHYAGIAAKEMLEKNLVKRADIKSERKEIEESLKMTPEEILFEATNLTQR